MIARRFRMGRSEVHVGEVGFVTKTAFLRERSVLGGFRHESYLQHGRSFVSRMFRETMYPLYLHRVDAKCRSEMANESGVNTISLDACLRFVSKHQMAPWCIHISCLERVARSGSGRESVRGLVGAMDAELSRPDWLATVQSGRKQVQSRVCTPSFSLPRHQPFADCQAVRSTLRLYNYT